MKKEIITKIKSSLEYFSWVIENEETFQITNKERYREDILYSIGCLQRIETRVAYAIFDDEVKAVVINELVSAVKREKYVCVNALEDLLVLF